MVSLLKDLMLDGVLPNAVNIAFHVLLAGIALLGFLVRRHVAQMALAIGTVILFTSYVVLLFARL
jgi:hypothetical protein